MSIGKHVAGPLVVAVALLFSPVQSSIAAPPGAHVGSQENAGTARLVITITTTNRVVRGRVSVDYRSAGRHVYRACASLRCRLVVPRGAKVFFRQTPTDPYRWHFRYWKLTNLGPDSQTLLLSQPTTGIAMTTDYRMSAEYVRVRR